MANSAASGRPKGKDDFVIVAAGENQQYLAKWPRSWDRDSAAVSDNGPHMEKMEKMCWRAD